MNWALGTTAWSLQVGNKHGYLLSGFTHILEERKPEVCLPENCPSPESGLGAGEESTRK